MTKITVCVLTFKRPQGLGRLLEKLDAQQFDGDDPELHVVVVDNDSQRSGEAVCDRFRPKIRWELHYRHEPRRGIAFARNAALDAVASDTEFVSFIDDDEVPDANWLAELVRVQGKYDADVVGGPVVPYFPEPIPSWVVRGSFFVRRRRPTGTRLGHAFTGNVLFRWAIVGELNIRFDERFALMGCEDRHFFQQIGMAGYAIVWADDAVAHEWILPSRANQRWLIQRMFRVGNSTTFVEVDLTRTITMRATLAAKGITWLGIGFLRLPYVLVSGRVGWVKALGFLAYGAGMLWGLAGKRYEEYRTTQGD